MATLREMWPKGGLMIAPESPVGLTPADQKKDNPNPGDTWFSEDGNTVYQWTGTQTIIMISIEETP